MFETEQNENFPNIRELAHLSDIEVLEILNAEIFFLGLMKEEERWFNNNFQQRHQPSPPTSSLSQNVPMLPISTPPHLSPIPPQFCPPATPRSRRPPSQPPQPLLRPLDDKRPEEEASKKFGGAVAPSIVTCGLPRHLVRRWEQEERRRSLLICFSTSQKSPIPSVQPTN